VDGALNDENGKTSILRLCAILTSHTGVGEFRGL